MTSGFRREAAENCALLSYYAASSGNFLPTFRDNVSVPPSGFKNPKEIPHILRTPKSHYLVVKSPPPATCSFHYVRTNNFKVWIRETRMRLWRSVREQDVLTLEVRPATWCPVLNEDLWLDDAMVKKRKGCHKSCCQRGRKNVGAERL